MNELEARKFERHIAATKAAGFLKACVHGNDLPPCLMDMAQGILADYNKADGAIMAIIADMAVPECDWQGDHAGYLAAQHDERVKAGIEPTQEQVAAWHSINMVDVTADREPF